MGYVVVSDDTMNMNRKYAPPLLRENLLCLSHTLARRGKAAFYCEYSYLVSILFDVEIYVYVKLNRPHESIRTAKYFVAYKS